METITNITMHMIKKIAENSNSLHNKYKPATPGVSSGPSSRAVPGRSKEKTQADATIEAVYGQHMCTLSHETRVHLDTGLP